MNIVKNELTPTGFKFTIENGNYLWEYEKEVGYDQNNNVVDKSVLLLFGNKALNKSIYSFHCGDYLWTLSTNLLDKTLIKLYKYDIKTKNIEIIDKNKLAELYFDNNLEFAKKVWEVFIYNLAQYKSNFKNANIYNQDVEKYGFIKMEDTEKNEILLLTYNIDKNKAKELFNKTDKDTIELSVEMIEDKENKDPENVKNISYNIKPDYDDNFINNLTVNYEIRFNSLKYQDKSYGEKLVNTLIEKATNANMKVNKSELNKGLELYDGYLKDINQYNYDLDILINELKSFTGNYKAAPKILDDKQKQQYIKLTNKLSKYKYNGRVYHGDGCIITKYNDCHKYITFLGKVVDYISSFEKGWKPAKIEFNIGDNFRMDTKPNMSTIFVPSMYDIRKETDDNKKDELHDKKIEDIKKFINNYYGEKIYISFKDFNGTTYTTPKPMRLFWSSSSRLCYFKNNSTRSGYPVDNFEEIYRLDVIDKTKKENNNCNCFCDRTPYSFFNFLQLDWI